MFNRSARPEEVTGIDVTLDAELRGVLAAGIVQAPGIVVEASQPPLKAEFAGVAEGLRQRYTGHAPAQIGDLGPARELYRAFGIDPTKTRPSSESLLRRVLKSAPLPQISNAVDLCNLLSLRFLLPIGLYDVGCIRGAVRIRRGRPGESYAGIRKAEVHLEGRPLLADSEGPFGNPTSDSARTSVGGDTAELLLVIFAPASFDSERLIEFASVAAERISVHLQRDDARKPVTWTTATT